MHLREIMLDLQDAWADIRSRPFRSALSAIGICVGVLSLVAMLSITGGAREEALAGAESLGLDKIRIEASTREEGARSAGLIAGDGATLLQETALNMRLAYFERTLNATVQADNARLTATRFAVSPEFFNVEALTFEHGLPWPDREPALNCVVGATLARELNAVPGDTLVVNDSACTLTGTLAAHPALVTEGTGLSAIDFDTSVFVPYSALRGTYPRTRITSLVVQIAAEENFENAVREISRTLREAHEDEQDFTVVVPRALAAQVDETQSLFTLIMSAIAGLALLVGGIGIANNLLATIAEQTREIGLRMAVGAPPQRVLALYVLHALCICAVGAFVGAFLGLAVAGAVQTIADWRIHLSVPAVLVGVAFALLTGVLSASYPALRASRMSPAAALIDH